MRKISIAKKYQNGRYSILVELKWSYMHEDGLTVRLTAYGWLAVDSTIFPLAETLVSFIGYPYLFTI